MSGGECPRWEMSGGDDLSGNTLEPYIYIYIYIYIRRIYEAHNTYIHILHENKWYCNYTSKCYIGRSVTLHESHYS